MTDPRDARSAAAVRALEGVLFRLHAQRCGRPVEAVCSLWSQAGRLELTLEVAGTVQRSAMPASHDEAIAAADTWRSSLLDREWR